MKHEALLASTCPDLALELPDLEILLACGISVQYYAVCTCMQMTGQ